MTVRFSVSLPTPDPPKAIGNRLHERLRSTRYPFATLPKDYGELCRNILLPRPIRDRYRYRETPDVTDAMAGHRLNRDQTDCFGLLRGLIESGERDHEPRLPEAPPLQTVATLRNETCFVVQKALFHCCEVAPFAPFQPPGFLMRAHKSDAHHGRAPRKSGQVH